MSTLVSGLVDTFSPRRNVRHGPLPSLLVVMTVVTGLVDAFSYLVLGHVFVANMTGNVVFLGFALAGAPGFSITASLAAVAAFVLGAGIGGRLYANGRAHRATLLYRASAIQAVFLLVGMVLALGVTFPANGGYRYALIGVMGVAMGIQNATARKLAVPDLTTTVLTLTITGMVADVGDVQSVGVANTRRLIAVLSMFVGGLVGAILVLHSALFSPLLIAAVAIAAVALVAFLSSGGEKAWHHS
ncbi:MAG: YoaK family protein [Acidimicrobiales bacterium]|jgi:uncharacterized membrane protein YoaK (UPF0700 family)